MKTKPILSLSALLLTVAVLAACRTSPEPPKPTALSGDSSISVTVELTDDAGGNPAQQPTVGDWQWDPHVFDLLDGEYRQSAQALADAILAYEPSVRLAAGQAEAVCDNFAFEFPPAALVDLSVEGDEVKIDYLYDEQTHAQKIADFKNAVELALNSSVKPEDSEVLRALLLYRYVVDHVRYFTVDYTDKEITSFSALTEGVTICYGFADAFNYLLRQTGMEAHLYRGARSDGAEHGWSYVKIDGKFYHFDPTWECSGQKNRGYSGLCYFGMDDDRRYMTLLYESVCGFGALEHSGETDSVPDWLMPTDCYPFYGWSYDRASGEVVWQDGKLTVR